VKVLRPTITCVVLAGMLAAVGCAPPAAEPKAKMPKKAELLVELPDHCNTPDGMAIMPDGSIILSVPNYNIKSSPAVLVKITKDNKVEPFYTVPVLPETGACRPMGICVAPSGDIYLADSQFTDGKEPGKPLLHKSRVLRIEMKDGKPVKTVTVASGFNVANAVIIRDGYVYVSETISDIEAKPLISGVFRFKLGEEGVQLKPGTEDPHLIATIKTFNPDIPFGADGLTFDSKGNLYIGNFADGTTHKLVFDNDGKVTSNEIFAKADCMKSCDGIYCDLRNDKIYVADSIANAVQVILPDGSVETLAVNPESDGSNGALDQPCEVIVRGNEVIVSNMDWPVPGKEPGAFATVNTKFDKPYTISIIKLD